MHIFVAYALPHEQVIEPLDVPDETTVEQAIAMSSIPEQFPEIDLKTTHKAGIYAKLVKMDQPLVDGDRIEIYRSLPRKARDAHAADDKKERIRAKRQRQSSEDA